MRGATVSLVVLFALHINCVPATAQTAPPHLFDIELDHGPLAVAVGPSGNLYVSFYVNKPVAVLTPEGIPIRTFADLPRVPPFTPYGLAVDSDGSVYVADSDFHWVDKFGPDGDFVYRISDEYEIGGSGDGEFIFPYGVTTDSEGNVYVPDTGNNRVQVFTSDGTFVRKWGVEGTGPGEFAYPHSVAFGPDGNLYVQDVSNGRCFDPQLSETPSEA